jgi:hypothetical protein
MAALMNSPEQLWRTDTKVSLDGDNIADAFTPDDAWADEFEKQLSGKLIDGLHKYARPRAFAVAMAGRKVDDYYARELVADAIGDTWSGVLCWDPKRCTLEMHLMRAIQSRSDKHRKHVEANPHDSIGDESEESRAAEEAATATVSNANDSEQRVYLSEAMSIIRREAVNDRTVLRLLEAFDAGAETKNDVLAFTKMKERTYNNAHARLRRLVRNLTDRTLAPRKRA